LFLIGGAFLLRRDCLRPHAERFHRARDGAGENMNDSSVAEAMVCKLFVFHYTRRAPF
jgi:hypothetical protein